MPVYRIPPPRVTAPPKTAVVFPVGGFQSITPTGTLTTAGNATVKVTGKAFAGTLTSSGAAIRWSLTRAVAGALTAVKLTGAIRWSVTQSFAGALSAVRLTGALVAAKTYIRAMAGTLTTAGALTKLLPRTMAGALTAVKLTGALVRQANKALAGVLGNGLVGRARFYGEHVTNGTLANTVIGPTNWPGISSRMVMTRTSTVTSFRFYALWGPGYGGGLNHAGSYVIEAQSDDGTANHYPSGSALGTTAAIDLQATAPGATQNVAVLGSFLAPFAVTTGQIVHFVFKQSGAPDGTNYASLDSGYDAFDYLGSFGPEPMHAFLFPDLGLVINTGGSSWSNTADGRDHFWVIGEVAYSDGHFSGNNNIDSPSNTAGNGELLTGAYNEITATKAVRQTFTPAANVPVAGLSIRIVRVSGTGALTVTLKHGGTTDFAVVRDAGTFTAGGRGTGYAVIDTDWADVPIAPLTLTASTTYTLTMTSTGDGLYRMVTVRDGNAAGYAYSAESGFGDGSAEYTTDGTTWHTWDTWGEHWPAVGDMDLQLAFTRNDAPTFAGALTRGSARSFAGSLTAVKLTGALTNLRVIVLAAAGTLATAGALRKQINRAFSGTLGSVGAVVRSLARSFAGTLPMSGALVAFKVIVLAMAGTLTAAGALTKRVTKALAAALPMTGAVTKWVSRTLTGTLTMTGALARSRLSLLTAAGTLTSSGALRKTIARPSSGTLTSTGSLTKRVSRAIAGLLASAGDLLLQQIGPITNVLDLTGTLTFSSTLSKSVSFHLAGVLTFIGQLFKRLPGPMRATGVDRSTDGAAGATTSDAIAQAIAVVEQATGSTTTDAAAGVSSGVDEATGRTE